MTLNSLIEKAREKGVDFDAPMLIDDAEGLFPIFGDIFSDGYGPSVVTVDAETVENFNLIEAGIIPGKPYVVWDCS